MMEIKGQPGREMLHLEGIMELVQYLDQNNPEALKELEKELQEIIDKYKEKYKIIEEKSRCKNCGRTDYPQTEDGYCGFCDPWNYPDEISEE